jgi:hypothetical protein
MQGRWRIEAARREIALSLDEPGPRDFGDLLFVQRELTDALLNYYDLHAVGGLERRGERVAPRLRTSATVW